MRSRAKLCLLCEAEPSFAYYAKQSQALLTMRSRAKLCLLCEAEPSFAYYAKQSQALLTMRSRAKLCLLCEAEPSFAYPLSYRGINYSTILPLKMLFEAQR